MNPNIALALEILKIFGPAVIAAVTEWNALQVALATAQAAGRDITDAELASLRTRAEDAIARLAAASPQAGAPTTP